MSKHILVVDDYPAMLSLVQAILEAFTNYAVQTANDGAAAKAIIEESHPFDVALLDLNISGKLCGLELAPIVRRYSPGCAIVYVTGQDVPANLLHEGAPYTGHVKKPFHLRDLLGAVNRALQGTPVEPSAGRSPVLDEVYAIVPVTRGALKVG